MIGAATPGVQVATVTINDVLDTYAAGPSARASLLDQRRSAATAPLTGSFPIYANQFHSPGSYEDITIATYVTGRGNSSGPHYDTEVSVQWLDTRDLYIDYVWVRDQYDYSLFVASDSLATYQSIRNDFSSIHLSNPARNFSWYGDEPRTNSLYSYSKVSSLGVQATSVPLNGANAYYGSIPDLQQFKAVVSPNELIIDPYTILSGRDSASSGTYSIQGALDPLADYLRNGIVATNGTIPLWYCMQTCGDVNNLVEGLRNPTRNELFAEAYLGLAYGAKGFMYYVYPTIPPWQNATDYTVYGLVDLVDAGGNPTTDPHGYFVPNYKWNAVREIHNVLDVIGPTALGIHWLNAGAVHRGQLANVSSVVLDARASDESGVEDSYPSETYVEIGIFDSTGSPNKYIMAVNRRVLSSEQRNLQITLSSSLTSQFLQVTDVYSGTRWAVARGASFTDLFQPGQGKLYRVEPLDLTALAAQGKTISSQATAFDGQRKLYRESSGKLHEVFASGTITQGEIFYRNSKDDGVTWGNTAMLSDGTGASLAPCIAMRSGSNNVIVVWQQTNGSNYNVAYRRSTDGGSTWGSITALESNFACASPGPLPSVAFNPLYGFVLVTYRSSLGLRWAKSTNSGASWTAPGTTPYNNANYNSPTMGWYPIPYSPASVCNVAFATALGYPSQIYYGSFTNQSSAWSAASSLSGVLPGTYCQHQNPSLAVSTTSTTTVHVAWEASAVPPPAPLLVYRKGTSGNFGSQYNVIQYQSASNPSITGLTSDNAWMVFQNSSSTGFSKVNYYSNGSSWVWGSPTVASSSGNYAQLSVGSSSAKYLWTSGTTSPYTVSLGGETLSKEDFLPVNYARELNVIDSKTGSSLTLEVQQLHLVHKDRTSTPVDFVNAPADSVLIGVKEIWSLGKTEAFMPLMSDTVKLHYAVKMMNTTGLLQQASASFAFNLLDVKSGKTLSALGTQAITGSTEPSNVTYEIAFPMSRILNLTSTSELAVEPAFSGVTDGTQTSLIASLGHIYRLAAEGVGEMAKTVASGEPSPRVYHLEPNYPNPFNPSTTLRYALPVAAHVTLSVYNTLGQKVAELANGEIAAGYHEVRWEALGLASGIYFARLTATDGTGQIVATQTTNLVLMK
jgi:hypothetical protein